MKARTALIALTISIGQFSPFPQRRQPPASQYPFQHFLQIQWYGPFTFPPSAQEAIKERHKGQINCANSVWRPG
jgi:hypothetical protein